LHEQLECTHREQSVHKFASNPTDRQTNRQTDKQTNSQTNRPHRKHNLLPSVTSTSKTSDSIESTASQVILGGGVAVQPVCLLLSEHRAVIFTIVQLSCTSRFYPRDTICYSADIIYATTFPSVCVSHACFVSKWLNVSSKFFCHLIAPSF